MAEFRLGRLKFNWTGDWKANWPYVLDDIISFKGNTYICVVNHTSAASQEAWEDTDLTSNPPKWQLHVPGVRNAGVWTPNTFYARNDLVRYGGNIYACKDNHTSPSNQNLFYATNFVANWGTEPFYVGTENKGPWTPNTWYKENDLVKYGNNIYICKFQNAHTSTTVFDPTKFDIYLESVKFEDSWDQNVEYQPGDIVLFGGYSYSSKTININKQPNTFLNTDWEVITVGFSAKGNYNPATIYVPGDVVRYGGNTFVKLITSAAGIAPGETGDGAVKWGLITEGLAYKGAWIPGTTYQKNDVVTSGTSTFISVVYNNVNVDPAAPGASSNWSLLSAGAEAGTLTQKGDLLYRATATNARLAIGGAGQILYASELGIPTWGNNKARKVYFVTLDGIDDFAAGYGQSIGRAFRTVKYAVETATAEGCDEQNPATIYVKAGVYNELCPILVPSYCSIVGDDSRGTIIQPDLGLEQRPDGSAPQPLSKIFSATIPVNWAYNPGDSINFSGGKTGTLMHFTDGEGSQVGTDLKRRAFIMQTSGATDLAINDTFTNDGVTQTIVSCTRQPNERATLFFLSEGVMLKDIVFNNPTTDGGFVAPTVTGGLDPDLDQVAYDEQAADIRKANIGFVFFRIAPNLVSQKIIKSPYIYSCASYGKKCVGALVDGSINEPRLHPNYVNDPSVPKTQPIHGHQSMLFGNVTQFPEGGCAIWVKDNGNSEIVSCFTYYAFIGYASTNGARIRSLAGNNSWGSYGSVARGFDPVEVPLQGTVRGSELILPLSSFTSGAIQSGSIISNERLWVGTGTAAGTTTLTVSTLTRAAGFLFPGATIKGAGIPEGTYIVSQLTGTTGNTGTYQLSTAVTLPAGTAISGQSPMNNVAITGFSAVGGIATLTFAAQTIAPFEQGKKIVITNSSNAILNRREGWTVLTCNTTQVTFATSETSATVTNAFVKPIIARAEVLYVTEFDIYRKLLIETITGYFGNNTKIAQITSNTSAVNPPSTNPAPVATTITPGVDTTDDFFNSPLSAANRSIRGAKFPVLNLPEKPKITSAVTFNGDTRNYVIQEVENYSSTAPSTLKIANATRTKFFNNSLAVPTIPIARTGTFASPVLTPASLHLGGTDVTLYNLLPDTNPANYTDIDNEGSTLTSTTDTQINLLDAGKVQAAMNTYNTANTELLLLVGNEIMRPLVGGVVNNQFDSYVTVLRGQEGTIAQEHADKDNPTYPQNARIRFLVKYTPVTTLRSDLTDTADSLIYSSSLKSGGITFFDFTSDNATPNTLFTIDVGDYIKIDNEFFRIDLKQTPNPGSAILSFYPSKPIPESSGTAFFIRYRYSQIRLTGHDMLEIGTGGIATTNFPDEPKIRPRETRETNFVAPARIYYVTTNQDGNFKVGEFFRIDQATGKTNIDASQISLVGIGAIQFGNGGALVGSQVSKFDPSVDMAAENASDGNVPTQLAVKKYVENNFLPKTGNAEIGSVAENATLTVFGDTTVKSNLSVDGNFVVSGTTTTVNSETLTIEDKNIVLGNVNGTPDDTTADGGGLTLLGTSNKTINWLDSSDAWTSSEHFDLVTTKSYRIAGNSVLSSTDVLSATTTANIANLGTTVTIGATTGTTSVRNTLVAAAGTTTLAPLRLTSSSSILATPVAGSVEYANGIVYATPSANAATGRAFVPTQYFRRLNADRAALKQNATAALAILPENVFSATAGGQTGGIQLTPQTLYRFRGMYYVTTSSAAANCAILPQFNSYSGTISYTANATQITVTATNGGVLAPGMTLTATGVPANTVIVSQVSATVFNVSNQLGGTPQTNIAATGVVGPNMISNIHYSIIASAGSPGATTASYYNNATPPTAGSTLQVAVATTRTIIVEGEFYHNGVGTGFTTGGILYPQIARSAQLAAAANMTFNAGTSFELTPILSGAVYPAANTTILAGAGAWT